MPSPKRTYTRYSITSPKVVAAPENYNITTAASVAKAMRAGGRRSLKAGSHPQQYWRQPVSPVKVLTGTGARLGPAGELGDDVLIEIKLSPSGVILVGRHLSPKLESAALLSEVIAQIYNPLVAEMHNKINLWVPIDSGDLRRSLLNSLSPAGGSYTSGFPLFVVLNTKNIIYAKPVNKMPKHWFKIPTAVENWYNLLVLHGRKFVRTLYSNFVKNYLVPEIRPFAGTLGIRGGAIFLTAFNMFSVATV